MFAAARILEARIKITEVDKNCTKVKEFSWGEENSSTEINVITFEDMFGIIRKA